ncbi:LacI family DNA-binding transcriptional regulator [Microbacterium sp. SLBN-146]|uniref:LacI family DNA-binding transcriptional regulator n=1 Tax=Microbacterium sp. SLBN-146 TaxID=2768457 RepID=UPI00114F3D2B|nr:LacI family DNA-binding transcriptional regulator [Microbacterium sp. SLBN-146]TQJ31102.1 LacI family transcriptional regulator [Microbacterium sp. SLBN-146]
MNATMHDVARVAGVSIKTVSNVINEYPHVRATTRDRVLVAIKELGYQPNLSARGLRSGKTGVIGLAIPSVREPYFAELADAVIAAAERRGLGVVVDQTNQVREHELDVIAGRRLRLTDGIIFSPVNIGESDAELLKVPFPLVILGESIFGGPTDHVSMHNVSSARAATEHLIAMGRRRIAVIGADDDEEANAFGSATLRVRGYHQALQAAGIPADPALVVPAGLWHLQTGAAATRALLDSGATFDGLFALNDTMAVGALRALAEAGVSVPDDVAIIGFDNIDATKFSIPSLSTVDAGRTDIAELAVEMLVERITRKVDGMAPRRLKPEFRIVARESTGHPFVVDTTESATAAAALRDA